jgi:hypothetical protein
MAQDDTEICLFPRAFFAANQELRDRGDTDPVALGQALESAGRAVRQGRPRSPIDRCLRFGNLNLGVR